MRNASEDAEPVGGEAVEGDTDTPASKKRLNPKKEKAINALAEEFEDDSVNPTAIEGLLDVKEGYREMRLAFTRFNSRIKTENNCKYRYR